MIRFIDLRKQDTGYRFAFFDTSVDKFCEFDGEHVWDSQEDLVKALDEQVKHGLMATTYYEHIKPRLLSLMPDWAKQPVPDEEEISELWGFDDKHIGKIKQDRSCLQTRLIPRPNGLTPSAWYAHATTVCQYLNEELESD